jgi:amidohydrolase
VSSTSPELLAALDRELASAVVLRHQLHANPELGHHEHATAEVIADALGQPVQRPLGPALLAHLEGPGTPVLLRAELDGLPVAENTGLEWSATNGAMHACGHDIHMAALVAVVRALRTVGSLPAAMTALFQSSEEAHPSGAHLLVEAGVLPPVRAVVGAHVHPDIQWRSAVAPSGPINASLDFLRLTVRGEGGHSAYPHRTHDPVLALAAIIVAAQQVISRQLDPLHAGVIAFTRLQAGSADNIVPDSAEARGSLRALDPADREALQIALRRTAEHVGAAYGCQAELHVSPNEPTLVNDPSLAAAAALRIPECGLKDTGDFRSCGSDDFSFYEQLAPTLMLFVGLDGAPGFVPRPLHSVEFAPPDETVELVARAYLAGYLAASDRV